MEPGKEEPRGNIDPRTVEGFGEEWGHFTQEDLAEQDQETLFGEYFSIFPWQDLPSGAVGFDLGCGSGRWARGVAPKVGRLHCVDASVEALAVARKNLKGLSQCEFHHASVDSIPVADGSMDFGYSLGVLHHVPETAAGMRSCAVKLKKGAPFLVYLYYAMENKPFWFRAVWKASDLARRVLSASPFLVRRFASDLLALVVYLPLARGALILEKLGFEVGNIPLAVYRTRTFYSMRTDALDRFGTRLEQRFTAAEIAAMMEEAGLERVRFREAPPYWVALGFKK